MVELDELTEERLKDWAIQLHTVVKEFRSDYGHANIDETPNQIHHKLLGTQQIRNYLSGQVAELSYAYGLSKSRLIIAEASLKKAQAEVVSAPRVTKDYDSALSQESRMNAVTLDYVMKLKKAELELQNIRTVLDYAKAMLDEFTKLGHDLSLRVKILYTNA